MRKLNLLKKAIAMAVIVAMAVGMMIGTATAAFAADTGAITVHKYGRPTPGTVTDNTHTGEIIDETGLGDKLQGVEFKLYKLTITGTNGLNDRLRQGYAVDSYTFSGVNPITSVSFVMTKASVANETVVAAAAAVSTKTTDANGVAEFGKNGDAALADGYYVLEETKGKPGYDKIVPTIIRMPLTKRATGEPNRDIHVYPKNITSTDKVTKDLDGGMRVLTKEDPIMFTIKADFRNGDDVHSVKDLYTAPSTYGKAFVIDEIQPYFTYDTGRAVAVRLLDGAGAQLGGTLTSPGDFTVDTTRLTAQPHAYGKLVVNLTNAGILKAYNSDAASYEVKVPLIYKGAQGLGNGSALPVKNVAMSGLSKAGGNPIDPDDPPIDIPDTTLYLPTLNIKVNKSGNDVPVLAGVEFQLQDASGNYVKDGAGNIIKLTTDGSGNVTFAGMDYHELLGSKYYLEEVKTMPGYQLKTALIEVVFKTKAEYKILKGSEWFEGDDWKKDVVIVEPANIMNYRLGVPDPDSPVFSLPLTGGAGTVMFTIAGIVIMLGAAVWFLRRKSKDEVR